MATLTFDALWRDHGVASGLKSIATQAAKTKLGFDKLGTSSSVFKRLAASSSQASRAGMSIGTNLQRGIVKPMAGLPGIIAGLVGGATVGLAKKLADEAGSFNETVSKSRVIFGTSSKAIESWAKSAANNMGLSTQAALAGTAQFGNFFNQLGFGVKQSKAMSQGFVQMSSDLGSFNDADPAGVMEAFQSATRGEYDALQKFIPTLSAATVEAEAMRQTHKKSTGDLTAADKAAALYSLSVKGMGKAQGDFARTGGGYAGQLREAAGHWSNLRIQIGQHFIPIFLRAARHMNEEGFPALSRIVEVLGTVGKAAGRMGTAVLKVFSTTFATAIDGATTNLTEIADWMETHQEKMVRFFIRLGDGAIGFGRGITTLAVSGIRSFGDMSGAMGETVRSVGNGIASLMEGAAKLLPPWSDARKDLLRGAADIRTGANSAADGLAKTKTKAHEAANAISTKVTPVFDKAQQALHRVGNEEIWKAKQRDAAAKASIAIRDIGTKADGSQIKLKTWNDRTKLGADAQRALELRIKAARTRMLEQRDAGIKAGDSQVVLTKRWDKGREALYREFRQMGLSKEEARKLAIQYGKVPGKKETKVSAPGAVATRRQIQGLDTDINNVNSKSIKLTAQYRAVAAKAARAFFSHVPGSQASSFAHLPLGGPPKGAPNLNSMVGAPIATPESSKAAGGPTVTVRHSAPGASQIRRQVRGWDEASARAASEVGADGLRALTSTGRASLAALAAAQSATATSGTPGGTVRTVPGRGWATIMAAMRRHGARRFTTYPGHHPTAERARDVTPHNWAAANAARALSGVWYVIYRMRIASKNHGNIWRQYHPTSRRGDWTHNNHIHVARYDGGGRVRPGQLAYNHNGGVERMLSERQNVAFERMVSHMDRGRGAGGNTYITVNVPNGYIGSQDQFRKMLVDMNRRGQLEVIKR